MSASKRKNKHTEYDNGGQNQCNYDTSDPVRFMGSRSSAKLRPELGSFVISISRYFNMITD